MSRELRNEAKRLKLGVLERHNKRCYVCEFDCGPVLIVHHIKPISEGGTNDPEWLVTLCPNCHAVVHKLAPVYSRLEINLEFGPDALCESDRAIWHWMLRLSQEQSDRFLAIARKEPLPKRGNNEQYSEW